MGDNGRVITEALAAAFETKPANPVAAYNERVLAPLDPQFDTFARALGGARDVRLDIVAGELAGVQARGGLTTRALAEFLTHSYGVIEPVADLAVTHATTDDDRIAEIKRAFGNELNFGNTRIGFGADNGVVVAVLFYSVRVTLGPFPRSYVGSADAHGELAPGLDRLALTRWMAGHLPELQMAKLTFGAFRERVPCSHAGTSWLSFDALDKDGAAHILQLPVACGEPAPASYVVEPAANFAETDHERHIAAIISRERALKNLPPFEVLPVVQTSAHMYAELKARGIVVTEPPRLGGHAWWTVFHADSYEEAVESILNDPAKRRALDRTDFNRVGVGVVPDKEGGVWVALVYARVPHPIETLHAAAWIGAEFRKRRLRVGVDDSASDLARRIATQLALGWQRADLEPALRSWSHTNDVNAFMTVQDVASLDEIDLVDLVDAGIYGSIGVGVAQSAASGTLTGTIWVVVIYLGYDGDIPVMDPHPFVD